MSGQNAVNPAALGAKFGLLAGLGCVIFLLALFLIKRNLLLSPWILSGFVIIVAFKVAAAYFLWRSRGGEVAFKDSLQAVFTVSAISLLIFVLFFYLLFNFIDLSLLEQVKNNITANAVKSFEDGRITKEHLDAGIAKIEKLRFGLWEGWVAYAVFLCAGFFYALVLAAVSRLISRDIAQKIAANN